MLIQVDLDRDSALLLSYCLRSARDWWSDHRKSDFPSSLEELLRFAEIAKTGGWTEADTDEHGDASGGNTRSDEPEPAREFFKQREVAAISGYSTRTIRRRIAAGRLASTPLGIPRSEIERLTKGRTHART